MTCTTASARGPHRALSLVPAAYVNLLLGSIVLLQLRR